jgi:F-type H+-transporting ATPase subunit alpha
MKARTDTAALNELRARMLAVPLGPEAQERGEVLAVSDGIAQVSGLASARMGEVLRFESGKLGYVLALDEDVIQAVFLDPMEGVEAGSAVERSGALLRVPVGEALLGRVVDPLGRPLDDGPPIAATETAPVERPAPGIIERDFVAQPLNTGILAIDALFAIGRGQRELIIGERATGKTAIAVDTILNQRGSDVTCIYVAIGQRATAVRRVIEAVRDKGPFARTIFVVGSATAEPGLRWLAPFAATSMAEWFRDRGGHALIVYDDLTKHAAVHRELALLSRQPPGREAYPGDIFYLHARLLERAAKLSAGLGGGSLTALPIAEIEAGNLSAYIPTNLISIADGQIVLSQALFAANQRPAVDIGLSVSRVGGKAQSGALKSVSGRMRLDYAQYLELRMFARFGGFGDAAMKARMARGERIGAILAQGRFQPLETATQVAILAAAADGLLDDLPIGAIGPLKDHLGAIIAADPTLKAFRDDPSTLTPDLRAALLDCVRAAAGRADKDSAP